MLNFDANSVILNLRGIMVGFQLLPLCLTLYSIIGAVFLVIYILKRSCYYFSFYFRSTHKTKWRLRKDKGAMGEYLLYKELCKIKGNKYYLFNLYIPTKSNYTEIDLIMINKNGIFVFESKNYSGTIYGDEHCGTWTQFFTQKQKFSFYNPIIQNNSHIIALRNLLGDMPMYNIVVFPDNTKVKCKFKRNDIAVLQLSEVNTFVSRRRKTGDFNPTKVYNDLKLFENASKKIKKEHIQRIKRKQGNK